MARILRQQSLKVLLTIIALLLAANLVVQGLGNGAVTRASTPVTAANGIPDSGAQLQAVADEVRGVNKRLDTMEAFLESGSLTVKAKVEKTDSDKDAK
jgi:hypothetical protein